MVNFYVEFVACGPNATISDVADHIDHIRDVAGVDYIGYGSDYDGLPADGDTPPHACLLPNLTPLPCDPTRLTHWTGRRVAVSILDSGALSTVRPSCLVDSAERNTGLVLYYLQELQRGRRAKDHWRQSVACHATGRAGGKGYEPAAAVRASGLPRIPVPAWPLASCYFRVCFSPCCCSKAEHRSRDR